MLRTFRPPRSGAAVQARALLILTTCRNATEADALASELVERRLAACVNRIAGIASTYRWQGSVHHDSESLLLIKTLADQLPAIEATIRARSGYELPELLAVPVTAGSADYLQWLAASVAAEE
jgi:periplasmic divalent cation tolerance protein